MFNPIIPYILGPRHFEKLYQKRKDPWHYQTNPFETEKYERTLATLPEGVKKILEVGASEGVFTEMLLKKGLQVTGVDVSLTAIERARERLARYEDQIVLLAADITKNDVEGTFDLVLAAEVLYYLGGRDRLLHLRDTFREALREDGYLLLVHFYPNGKIIHDLFQEDGAFTLVSERIFPHPERDYLITLLLKTPGSRAGDQP